MLDICPIPAFTDNYIWGISDGLAAWLVDPGEATPALNWLARKQLHLAGILITHHHPDHIGGIAQLQAKHPGLPIYGPKTTKIPAITHPVAEADILHLGQWQFSVMEVPAHTLDHIAYYLRPDEYQTGALFCGDTLFAAGCGRLFEGHPAQLHAALNKFKELPAQTLLCCAHEYTLANLEFALAVEPQNEQLQLRRQQETCKREAGLPTLPSTLALERATNPFLRLHSQELRNSVAQQAGGTLISEVDIMGALRRWKDKF